jgi:nicotinamidase-related amidase
VPAEPYPELASVLRELVTSVQDVLDGNLVGVYLVGSLAIGDFDLDSDVDFLVVTRDDITDEVAQMLQAMHKRIHRHGCYPAEHLEGSYISRAVLNRAETVGVQPLWYVDNGSTVLERSTHDNQWHVRWVLRERGIALFGPEATTLLAPVPREAMRNEVLGMIRQIAQDFAAARTGPLSYWSSRFGQSYAVLTYCRMLQTLQTATVQSKLTGMRWALQELDPRWAGLIEQAWTEREGVRHCLKIRQRAVDSTLAQTHKFIKYAVRESETRFARRGKSVSLPHGDGRMAKRDAIDEIGRVASPDVDSHDSHIVSKRPGRLHIMSKDKQAPYVTPHNIAAKTEEWLAAISGANTHRMRLHVPKSALLVIDMQRFFADPACKGYLPCTAAILPNLRQLLATFRRARRPVIFTRHAHHPEMLDAGIMVQWWKENIVEGTPESEILPELAPRANEKVVTKHRYSAFFDTDLETVLRSLKVEDLVLCGVMTNMCVESTARDAYFRDYRSFVPADATGAPTEEMHRASLLNLSYGFAWVTTAAAIVKQV